MERVVPCRAIVRLFLAILCLFSAAAISAEQYPFSEPLPEIKSPSDAGKSIQEKRAQIGKLQEEIGELREQLITGQQIEIELKMYEVNCTKMRRLRTDFATIRDGVPYTKEPVIASPKCDAGAEFIKALELNNIARMLSHDNFVVNCGEPFTFRKGAEFTIPKTPDGKFVRKVPEKEVTLNATPRANGIFDVAVRSKLAQVVDDSTFPIGQLVVPALHVQTIDTSVEMLLDHAVLLYGLPAIRRTEAIHTERGIMENHQEIETYFSIRIKQIAAEPTSTAVQPASATIPTN